MKPVFQIVADGENVTARVAERLLELRISDESGFEADTLELTLDDRDGRLQVPPHQSLIKVSLGLAGSVSVPLTPMGSFRVDETELSGPVRRMRISATATDMSGDIRSPRTRAWEGVSIKDMVDKIAGEAGLKPVVAPDLARIVLPYLAQTGESNLHLLTRWASRNGVVLKPADGRLVLVKRGAGEAADGTELEAIALSTGDMSGWSWRSADRGKYASVEASWTDLGSGALIKVVVGKGTPRRVLRHVHSSEDEARRAAQAALEGAARGAQSGRLSMAGFWPQVFAGARIAVADIRSELAGPWIVTRVSHALSDALITEIEIESSSAAAPTTEGP